MPTAPPPSASQASQALPPRLVAKTLVRVAGQEGLFRVTSPAGWGGKDYATPTHYNLVGPTGRVVAAVPAASITVMSDALREALGQAQSNPAAAIALSDPLRCLLNDPDATRRMAHRLFGNRADPNRPLREIAEMLVPRFFKTRCWACATALDNLYDEACLKCEGLKCKCGGCRCNWPHRTWGILPVSPRKLVCSHRSARPSLS